MKKTLLTIIILLSYWGVSATTKEIKISLDIAKDASFEVLNALREVEQSDKPCVISFEKGEYNFYPDKAFEKYCHFSNHCDALARIAFYINNANNLTIDGNGSMFIFHQRMVPFYIEKSKNITIKELSVDFEWSFHSEGEVVARDTINRTFDLKISSEYPYEIRNGELIFIKPYYEHTLGQSILYDPERKAIAYNTDRYTPITTLKYRPIRFGVKDFEYKYKVDERADFFRQRGKENQLYAEQISPGVVRISGHRKDMPPVGMVLTCKGEMGDNRFAPAVKVEHSDKFKAVDVAIHHAAGMGFIVENTKDIELLRCSVTPSRGRMVSTTADATHFVGCRGKIAMRECVFKNQLDDATNIHGAYQEVVDIIDPYTVGARVGHFQQLGFILAQPCDTIGFESKADPFKLYQLLTVHSSEVVNGRYHTIRFNEKLPENIKIGDLMENISSTPHVEITGCDISCNRARGLLISTPRGTVIKGNVFHNQMDAILCPASHSFWYESGVASNIVIEDNIFQDCASGGKNRAVISFVSDTKHSGFIFKNVIIRNNTFKQFDNYILNASNMDGLRFEGNTIVETTSFPKLHPNSPVVSIASSKDVLFRGNKYSGTAQVMVASPKGEEYKFD